MKKLFTLFLTLFSLITLAETTADQGQHMRYLPKMSSIHFEGEGLFIEAGTTETNVCEIVLNNAGPSTCKISYEQRIAQSNGILKAMFYTHFADYVPAKPMFFGTNNKSSFRLSCYSDTNDKPVFPSIGALKDCLENGYLGTGEAKLTISETPVL